MAYREENGQVVLTMSKGDAVRLMWVFGTAANSVSDRDTEVEILKFFNRLNSGNPHYTPYQVAESKKEQP